MFELVPVRANPQRRKPPSEKWKRGNVCEVDLSIRCLLEKKCVQEAYSELTKGVNSLEQLYLLGDVYMKMGFFSK